MLPLKSIFPLSLAVTIFKVLPLVTVKSPPIFNVWILPELALLTISDELLTTTTLPLTVRERLELLKNLKVPTVVVPTVTLAQK